MQHHYTKYNNKYRYAQGDDAYSYTKYYIYINMTHYINKCTIVGMIEEAQHKGTKSL